MDATTIRLQWIDSTRSPISIFILDRPPASTVSVPPTCPPSSRCCGVINVARHVSTQEAWSGASECLVNPSAKPSPSTSVGLLLHMGHSWLRSCEALIQMMRFQRWPEEMGRAPCMCWPRWRRPSVTLCSTSEHSASLKGTCEERHHHHYSLVAAPQ